MTDAGHKRKLLSREELDDICWGAADLVDTLGESDAAAIATVIVDQLIYRLRRDPFVPRRTFADWTVALGDLRESIEARLSELIDGHADLATLIPEIVDALVGDGESS
jgi:hypothetical protein